MEVKQTGIPLLEAKHTTSEGGLATTAAPWQASTVVAGIERAAPRRASQELKHSICGNLAWNSTNFVLRVRVGDECSLAFRSCARVNGGFDVSGKHIISFTASKFLDHAALARLFAWLDGSSSKYRRPHSLAPQRVGVRTCSRGKNAAPGT